MDSLQIILKSIQALPEQMPQNEFAEMILQGKKERRIQAMLADIISSTSTEHGLYALRRKGNEPQAQTLADVAILGKNALPQALIAIECMYTFDAVTPAALRFHTKLAEALRQLSALASRDIPKFGLLLATHPTTNPSMTARIPYRKEIGVALEKLGNEGNLRKAAEKEMAKLLKQEGEVTSGVIPLGNAFGTRVELVYWVVRKPS